MVVRAPALQCLVMGGSERQPAVRRNVSSYCSHRLAGSTAARPGGTPGGHHHSLSSSPWPRSLADNIEKKEKKTALHSPIAAPHPVGKRIHISD